MNREVSDDTLMTYALSRIAWLGIQTRGQLRQQDQELYVFLRRRRLLEVIFP